MALFSDDLLLEQLALKGGSALDLVYGITHRRSKDVDLSMAGGLWPQTEDLRRRVEARLMASFREEGMIVFDLSCQQRPTEITPDMAGIWGGYRIEFKIIAIANYEALQGKTNQMKREAEEVGEKHRRTFKIDISANEYCQGKVRTEMDGLTIAVYTPAMIAFEKIRAICQQMEEYNQAVTNPSKSRRARDFVDIFTVTEKYGVDFADPGNHELVAAMFAAKRVPLALIGKISAYREFHRLDFDSVKSTINPGFDLRGFDFYVEYVVAKCRALQTLWEK